MYFTSIIISLFLQVGLLYKYVNYRLHWKQLLYINNRRGLPFLNRDKNWNLFAYLSMCIFIRPRYCPRVIW